MPPSNDIVNAASSVSYRSLLKAALLISELHIVVKAALLISEFYCNLNHFCDNVNISQVKALVLRMKKKPVMSNTVRFFCFNSTLPFT